MSGDLLFDHNAGGWLLGACLLLAVTTVTFSTLRYLQWQWRIWATGILRCLFLAGLAWCLFMPYVRRSTTERLKPRFLIAVDKSASMNMAPGNVGAP